MLMSVFEWVDFLMRIRRLILTGSWTSIWTVTSHCLLTFSETSFTQASVEWTDSHFI